MLYGIITAVDRISFFNDIVLNVLEAASTRLPARALDRLSRTR
jgi:hypothetical protein